MNVLERKRGITLIALVITIITILILAGVSINSIIGKNGIVERAQTTGKIQTVASIKEALELEKGDLLVNSKTVNLNNYLDQISNGDKKYEISSKEIIDDKNAEIIVDDKYKFALKDTEEGDVEVTYQGVAASSDLSISAKSGTYVYPNSGTFTVTNNVSGGELTVSSDAINIATATIEGNTVTVVPGTTAGKANIIVKSSANGDYAENKVVHVATVQNGTIELSVTPYTGIYDGKAHDAITKINVNPTDAKIEYSIDGENYSETVPTITETSSFTVTVRASKAGYKTQITTETVKVNKAKGKLTLSATSGTLTYPTSGMFTVSGNTGTLSVASSNTNIATASINGSTVTVKPGTTAGKATITVTSAEASNYNEKSATYEATVQNGTISLSATPYTGTYDGKAHNAYTSVNVTPSDAKLEYSINGGTYSTTMPTITNTSSFTVTVKASKAGYKTQIKTETVRVNKAAGTLTLSATSGTLTYPTNATFTVSGNKGNLSVASSNTNIATASISGNTVTVKPGTTAGKATITVTSAEASNYNEKSATYTATVNNGTISLSATPYTGTYDGKAHNAVTKVTVTPSDAKIDYSTDGKTYSTTMPTITNTSSFTVTVRASKAGYKTQSTTQTVKVGGQIVIGTIKVVENSNGSGTAIAANGALTGKDLYITFSHSIASGSTSVSPSLPYKVTKNGTYTFTVTGTSNGITSKKTVSVTVNQYMSSSTGSNPYLPGNDFKKVDGTDLSNGLVIEDKDGSQYVWIEVPKTSTVYPTAGTNITNFDSAAYTKITADLENYTKAYKSGGYSDADDDAKHVMLKSVYENGGFYIGRFEEGTANAEESTTEGTSAGPVSKINMYPYRLLTLPEAMDLTKKVNAGNRTCTLMYEVQWNLVLAHLHNKGNISDTVLTQNSDSIGNTSSVSFTLNRGKYYANNNRGWQAYNVDYYNEDDEYYLVKSKVKQKHAALLTTGAADRNKVMNIYDFAGNVAEWTIGVYSSTHWPCVVRGNSYNSGSNAAYHGDAAWYDYDGNIGFRVSIY
ncbi:MAG: hypothetical protein ACLRTR_07565 [Clostridia bacterium]